MRRAMALVLTAVCLSILPGCSSGPISNCYYQEVDDFNDYVSDNIHFDNWYYWYCRDCGCRKWVPFGNCY